MAASKSFLSMACWASSRRSFRGLREFLFLGLGLGDLAMGLTRPYRVGVRRQIDSLAATRNGARLRSGSWATSWSSMGRARRRPWSGGRCVSVLKDLLIWMRRWGGALPEPLAFEGASQEAAGVRLRVAGDLLGRARGDDLAALVAAFRAEIDEPIGGLDDVEIVLDNHAAMRRIRGACGKPPAAWRCRRNAGRWWARRECRESPLFSLRVRCEASLRRWASPPESVVADWPRRR